MNRILFPTEFSAHAPQVYEYALFLAKKFDAEIYALHACTIPIDPRESINDYTVNKLKELDNFVAEKKEEKYKKVKVKTIVQIGFPVAAILKIIEEENIDFVVMGMQGRTNVLESNFGSVSLKLVNSTSLPVLLVPSMARFKKVQRIAYPMLFEFFELQNIQQVLKFSIGLNSKLIGVHINESKEQEQLNKENLLTVQEIFRWNDSYFGRVYFELKNGKFQEEIHNFITEEEIDILVMLAEKQNWKFRLFTPNEGNRIAPKITIPLLIWRNFTLHEAHSITEDSEYEDPEILT